MEKLALANLTSEERELLLEDFKNSTTSEVQKELLVELVETVNKLLKGNISIGEIRKLLGIELNKSKKG
jgi:predicted HTH domain antitoxin